jgi:hypothetical protein
MKEQMEQHLKYILCSAAKHLLRKLNSTYSRNIWTIMQVKRSLHKATQKDHVDRRGEKGLLKECELS